MHPGAEPLGRVRGSTHIRFVCTENASVSCPRGGSPQRGDGVLLNRILAFSEAPITAVHVSIDGDPLGKGHWAGGPLYVLPWDPSLYLKGLHSIQVKAEVSGGRAWVSPPLKLQGCFGLFLLSAQDSAGRSAVREQHFTLEDNLIPGFGLVQSFLLLTDHYILGRALFVFTIVMNVGGLTAFRFMRVSASRGEPALVPSHSRLDAPDLLLLW